MKIQRYIFIFCFVVLFFFTKDPRTHILGIPSVDLFDTVTLRGLFAQQWNSEPPIFFAPIGYDWSLLIPNRIDHITFLPFSHLPFPIADNLWWFSIVFLQACTAHRLGRYIGKDEWSGWTTMIFWLFSESFLREINLHHAPQSSLVLLPLYMEYLLKLCDTPQNHYYKIICGIILGITTCTYFYAFPFVILITCFFLYRTPISLLTIIIVSLGISLPEIFFWISKNPPLIDKKQEIIYDFDWLYLFQRTPLDKSIGLSIVVPYVMYKTVHTQKKTLLYTTFFLLLFIPLWKEISSIHPLIQRFHWPERISIFATLCVLPLVAALKKSHYLIPIIIMESFVTSYNYPFYWTSVKNELCLQNIHASSVKNVLALPLVYQQSNLMGLHQRIHKKQMMNPLILPTGNPKDWKSWWSKHSILASLEIQSQPIPNQEAQIKKLNLDVIYYPDGGLSSKTSEKELLRLEQILGKSIDIGCAHVWWYANENPPTAIDGDWFREQNTVESPSLPQFMNPFFLEE